MRAEDDEPVEKVDPAWLESLLRRLPQPSYPLTSAWGLSIGDLVSARWHVPRRLVMPLRLLNRVGGVRLSPAGVGIDHKDIAWRELEEVRLVPLFDLLRGGGVEHGADALARFLPPVPGRRWLLRRVVRVLTALAVRFSSVDQAGWPLVPGELVHRGRLGRTKETHGGLVSALLWSAVPDAVDVLEETARARGITVTRPAAPA